MDQQKIPRCRVEVRSWIQSPMSDKNRLGEDWKKCNMLVENRQSSRQTGKHWANIANMSL